MKYQVFIVVDAEEDLYEIYEYMLLNGSLEKATKLVEKLKYQCGKLSKFPNRGHKIPELERVGVYEFLETLISPIELFTRS